VLEGFDFLIKSPQLYVVAVNELFGLPDCLNLGNAGQLVFGRVRPAQSK
jgi:hypothetical protein